MAKWQIANNDKPIEEVFDDETALENGDEGFSTDLVKAHCESLGAKYGFNYINPVL